MEYSHSTTNSVKFAQKGATKRVMSMKSDASSKRNVRPSARFIAVDAAVRSQRRRSNEGAALGILGSRSTGSLGRCLAGKVFHSSCQRWLTPSASCEAPETSFREERGCHQACPAQQDGPCILVGHSYGGRYQAGTDPCVPGLVYIAAHMPDAGEMRLTDGKRCPRDSVSLVQ